MIKRLFNWWTNILFPAPEPSGKVLTDEAHLYNMPEGDKHVSIIDKDTNDVYYNSTTALNELAVKIPAGHRVIMWVMPKSKEHKMYSFELGGNL